MTRIFFSLSIVSVLLMLLALVIGMSMDDLNGPIPTERLDRTLYWATVHRLTGVTAALAVVFVNSIVVTYFIGTSRWCKEVVQTYQLDESLIARSALLKRRTFPWCTMSMLAVVGVIALGAASDPGTGRPNTAEWVNLHFLGALAGVAFVVWSYFLQGQNIFANHRVIEEVMSEVARIRKERGLS